MEKIAVISDIHGNIPALEAVLKDIRERGIKRIFCLGDLTGKGPHGDKAIDICREQCEVVLQGNWDCLVAGGEGPEFLQLDWHRERLGEERISYLDNLPGSIDFYFSGRKVRLFHTSNQGVMQRVYNGNPGDALGPMFANTEFTGDFFTPDTIGFADIHHVFYFCRFNKVLFNTGSVGNAVDEPSAAYVIMEGNYGEKRKGYFSLQILRLTYDVELAIHQAEEEGMPDIEPYAIELREGRYRGLQRLKDEGKI